EQVGEGGARRHGLARRPERYMVAAGPPAEPREFAAKLDQDPQVRVVRTIGRGHAGDGYPVLAVIETTPERAAALSRMAALRVEPDTYLGWEGMPTPELGAAADVAGAPPGAGHAARRAGGDHGGGARGGRLVRPRRAGHRIHGDGRQGRTRRAGRDGCRRRAARGPPGAGMLADQGGPPAARSRRADPHQLRAGHHDVPRFPRARARLVG